MSVSSFDPIIRFPSSQALLDNQLRELQKRYGMALWMITRVKDNTTQLLRVVDRHYGLEQGQRLEWQETFCKRMLEQRAPNIVADLTTEPEYQSAPINNTLSAKAYIGFPLIDSRNQLFGTLCALDPAPQSPSLTTRLAELEHEAALISYLLDHAVHNANHRRLTTFIEHPDRCETTGLPGRDGWRDIILQEQENCRDLGMESSVMYLQAAEEADSMVIADSLAALLREQDSVAHLGHNRFAILLTDTSQDKAFRVSDRIRDALNAKQLLVRLQHECLVHG